MVNQFAQSHCIHDDLETAIDQTTRALLDSIAGTIDLVFAFASGYSPEELDRWLPTIQAKTHARVVLGCGCETVVGAGLELENERAVSLWAARIPSAEIIPMHLEFIRSTGETAIVGWPEATDSPWPEDSSLIVLGEPFEFPMDLLLERFNEDRPGVRISGGVASGADAPGQARLLLNDETFSEGVVAIRFSGSPIRMLVSQGCRPIGEPMVITEAERNVILSVGGVKALDAIYELFNRLPTRDQRLLQGGLHVGRVIDEYQESFEYGDFLVRNVVGIDKEARSISIGDYVRPGQTIQFHVRDSESASAELEQMVRSAVRDQAYQAGLMFTCNGRGTNLFPEPHHDAGVVHSSGTIAGTPNNATVPLAGFFAAGEVGPVGNKNFLHGFTASLVLFDG